MKVLLVYPNISKAIAPQIGLLSLGTSLLAKGFNVKISDITFTSPNMMLEKIINDYLEFKPDFIGIHCGTFEYPFVSKLCKALRNLKNKKTMIVIGGPHMTFASEELISLCDWGIIGEGENIICDIAIAISLGRIKDIYEFNNIVYKKNGNIVIKRLSDLINLNTLPLPRWDLFDARHYFNHFVLSVKRDSKIACSFEGSRGCQFECPYCTNQALKNIYKWRGKFRREKSLEKLKLEILSFKNQYGLDLIYYIDQVIMTSRQRTSDYRVTFNDLKIPFTFMDRPDLVTEGKVKDMKEAGAYSANIGIESGDNEYRKKILNRKMKNETIIKSYQILKKNGIRTHSFTVFGLPDQDEKSMHKSYDLIKIIQPDSAQATTFFPLPGTKLEKYCIDKGYWKRGVYPISYYSHTYLEYSEHLKKIITFYCNLINSGVWENGYVNRLLEALCMRIPIFLEFYNKTIILRRSLNIRGVDGTIQKIIDKISYRIYRINSNGH